MNASNELLAEVTIDMNIQQSLPESVHQDELVAHEVLRHMQESQEPGQILPMQSHHHQDGQKTAQSPRGDHDPIQYIPQPPNNPTDQGKWNEMLYKLCLYKSRNSQDANVDRADISDNENSDIAELADWLEKQRSQYRLYVNECESEMNVERCAILEAVGVKWNHKNDEIWERQFRNLQAYKEIHGDTLVPRKWEGSKSLGEWVTDQRRQFKFQLSNKPNNLSREREQRLNGVGFTWMLRNRVGWDLRFQELIEYQQKHGHCMVPQHYKANKALGKWVSKQREQYRLFLQGKASIMKQEKINKLNTLGFCWGVKGKTSQAIQSLEQAHQERLQVLPDVLEMDDEDIVSTVLAVDPATYSCEPQK